MPRCAQGVGKAYCREGWRAGEGELEVRTALTLQGAQFSDLSQATSVQPLQLHPNVVTGILQARVG